MGGFGFINEIGNQGKANPFFGFLAGEKRENTRSPLLFQGFPC